jgi:hypothetical protein
MSTGPVSPTTPPGHVASRHLEPAPADGSYRPAWHSERFDSRNLGGITKDIGRSFSSAIAAAAAPPGSTSGSGGGCTGGGGGW